MRLHSFTYHQLVDSRVSPSFARILREPSSYHPDFSILVGETNFDYFLPDGVTDIVPLWDTNADSYVRWNRGGKNEFVWLFHDDPSWMLIARCERGIMARLWQQWAEFQESETECRRFADAIGFRYCEDGLKVIEDESDAIDKWCLSLPG